ncbi:MAG: hypothetical protein HGB12_09525 [Bacteroidetes bacterium]|nr:hypothetical protein [Bacteroidota bacterium]
MKIVKNDKVNKFEWKELTDKTAFLSPFQTESFYNFYNSISNYSAEVFAVEENNKIISLVVITIQKEKGVKAFFSKRGIIYGGPLIANDNEGSLIFLMDKVINYYKKKLIYIEIRNFFNYSQFYSKFKSKKWIFIPYLNYTLNIENKTLPEVLSLMKYNRRREIKLSLERNSSYKECETEEELIDLYNILKSLYVAKVKLPIPNFDFFKGIWNSSIGKVFVVIHEGRVIGGSFCIYVNGHSIYTMYYCGLREYDKKIFPTHLAVLAAIDYAINNNCKILDFMGAGLKGEEYGVRSYKHEFGGVLNEFGRYRIILKPFLFKVGLTGLELLKKLK